MALISWGVTWVWILPMRFWIGLPGIARGSAKFTVTATHAVST